MVPQLKNSNTFAIDDENKTITNIGCQSEFKKIFTSEFCATGEAIKLKSKRTLIDIDSLSSLNALKSCKQNDPLIIPNKEYLLLSCRIHILYTLAHINI